MRDDLVTAQTGPRHGESIGSGWRESEIELVHSSPQLLTAAGELFVQAGGSTSTGTSKLHHALGRQHRTSSHHQVQPTDCSSAGAVVTTYLAEQIGVILTRDFDVRQGYPGAVHRMQVATRRPRSVLSTYRPLFHRATTDPIRVELDWLAASLGAVRNLEVLRQHLLAALAIGPDAPTLGPVSTRIGREFQSRLEETRTALLVNLDSGRYFRLLDGLDSLTVAPPLTDFAGGRARTTLRQRVRHVWCRLHELVTLFAPEVEANRNVWLPEIAKATKRVRNAAEAAEPALGRPAAAPAAAKQMQDWLGHHHDAILAQSILVTIGAQMFLDGQNPFTIGRLHALEQARSESAERRVTDLWSAQVAQHLRIWIGRGWWGHALCSSPEHRWTVR